MSSNRVGGALALVLLAPALAAAQPAPGARPADDGYCDYVRGVASATAAPLVAPTLFGQFGFIEQPSFAVTPAVDTGNLRAIGGIRYSFTNLWTGSVVKRRAEADCRRHNAIRLLRGDLTARALAARLRVYDESQAEANRILADITADLEARRTTTQEATAMRMRVEELRSATDMTRRELAALPLPDSRPLGSQLETFRSADADVEASEGTLRHLQAYELSVRAGIDRYFEGNASTQYFAVVQVGINLGALWVGSGNARAAAGRKRYARSGRDPLTADANADQLRAMLDADAQRITHVSALVGDLERQREALGRLGGEESKRFRETLWFEWVEAKAELAYLEAHTTALREMLAAQAR